MKTNEGALDRVLRLVGGSLLLTLLAIGPVPGWGLIGLVGVIGVVTGLTGFCLPYAIFGFDTLSERERQTRTGGTKWSAS